jgi:uncharacterized protein (DUF2147 family)
MGRVLVTKPVLKRGYFKSGSVMPRLLSILLAGATVLGASSAFAAPSTVSPEGVWRNPKDSVHIALKPCNGQICGYVVWASPKAEAAARKGGTPNLVGTQLMRGFVVDNGGVGRGKVFIPDLNATFGGSAQLIDDHTMRARGCLFANVLCKTQIWTRIDTPV